MNKKEIRPPQQRFSMGGAIKEGSIHVNFRLKENPDNPGLVEVNYAKPKAPVPETDAQKAKRKQKNKAAKKARKQR